MAEENFILFKRDGQSSQEDVWDDTALIQAYDRAVNLAKEKVAARLGLTDDQSSDNAVPNGGRDASPTKSSGSKKQSWKVGDYVRSTYSEDGVVYEAIIEKIIPSSSSCLIKYLGYDNEEEVLLKDLEPSQGPAARRQQILASGEGVTSSDDMECEASTNPSAQASSGAPELHWQPVKPAATQKSALRNFPPSSMSDLQHLSIPPPPPPAAWPTTSSAAEMDSESLYSMLMSWYMAGYHTGYYQGRQQQQTRGSSTGSNSTAASRK